MASSPSLRLRLIAYLLLTPLLVAPIAWLIHLASHLSGFEDHPDLAAADLGYESVSALVIESIARTRDGSYRVEPNGPLRVRIEREPDLQFAVFKKLSEDALPGSSAKLATALSAEFGRERELGTDAAHFSITGPSGAETRGRFDGRRTPFGRMYVAVSGAGFHWADDLPRLFATDLLWLSTYFITSFVASAVVGWIVVRSGLAPLRRAAMEAERIDVNSLDQGITTAGVPIEIMPVIDAMNRALARLDANAMRMRRYTANAAHELRTPLAILRARLQNPDEPSFRADIERDASQLQAIVEQMLIAARITENQAPFRDDIDLVDTVRSVVALHMPLVVKCRRHIEVEATEPTIPCVRGNRRAVECILANLIDNAIRAEPEGGTILVRVESGPAIEVIDHGEGVAESDRDMIFEPFWHKSEAGAGLGLAIAKELVEKHGGRIWVEETPGGGATFKLAFPAVG